VNELAAEVISVAAIRGLKIGTAESLTGGLVSAALVDIPGASKVFVGSIVSYSPQLKTSLLGVNPEILATDGAVSASVASEMAEGALVALGCDVAVATTGVAGPDPDPVGGVVPGIAVIAVSGTRLGTIVREVPLAVDRAEVRAGCVRAALQALLDAMAMWE